MLNLWTESKALRTSYDVTTKSVPKVLAQVDEGSETLADGTIQEICTLGRVEESGMPVEDHSNATC